MIQKITNLFSSQDMTVGKPMTCLLRFSIPLLIGNLAQQLYSTVDSIIVGQYVGDRALSAIGTTLPIINLLLVLFIAISTGTSIMVAQYFGARERDRLSHSVGNAITLILASSVIIMAVGIPLSGSLLKLTNTPVETYDLAHTYLVIILAGVAFSGLYNILSGVLRGLGNSVYPLFVLITASILNIFLDIYFIANLHMGVGGAALATIISQAVSAILCLLKLLRMKDTVDINISMLIPDGDLVSQLMRLGLPSGITQVIFSMSMVFVQSLTNSMGYRVVTCTTAVMRIDGFAMMPNFTFGMAIATFVGQNIGANKLDRIEEGRRDILKISLTTSVILVSLLLLLGENLIRLFTSTEDIINLGVRQIRILAPGYVAMAVSQIFGGIMRGAGDTMPSMWISIITTVCIRVPLAYIWASITRSPMYPAGSPDALFFSLLISWVIGAILNYMWYRRGTWKEKSLIKYGVIAE